MTTGVMENKDNLAHLAWPYVEGNRDRKNTKNTKKSKNLPQPCGSFCLEDFGWAQPSGGMYSTVRDLGQVLSMLFQYDADTTPTPVSLLQPSTLREILLPSYITRDRQGGYATTFELYKMNDYFLRTKRGKFVCLHFFVFTYILIPNEIC